MYTFKAQAKSNAKRFLVSTCKLVDDFEDYLTQHEGQWGTWMDGNTPVKFATVVPLTVAKLQEQPAANEPASANPVDILVEAGVIDADGPGVAEAKAALDEPAEDDHTPAPSASAFGAFAMAQLGAQRPQQPEPEPVPAATSGIKIEKNRPQQNGITRPSAGTTCLRVWDLCDSMTVSLGRTVPLSAVIDAAKGLGINQFTARTQYACWRKFNGIFGRVQ